jgi:hypothetical protein
VPCGWPVEHDRLRRVDSDEVADDERGDDEVERRTRGHEAEGVSERGRLPMWPALRSAAWSFGALVRTEVSLWPTKTVAVAAIGSARLERDQGTGTLPSTRAEARLAAKEALP